jgi:hypothetical protein
MSTAYQTSKMSAEDIRQELVGTYGLTRETVDAIKGKGHLAELLLSAEQGHKEGRASFEQDHVGSDDEPSMNFGEGDNTGDFEMVDDEFDAVQEGVSDETTPNITDVEWTEYVLSNLSDDEKIDGNPTVDGLRRVTQRLVGPIVSSISRVIQTPSLDNEQRATVEHTIEVDTGRNVKTVSGCADVFSGNTDKMFAKFPVATAETRAEGRALRRLLNLRKVVAAEEIGGVDVVDDNELDPSNITSMQIRRMEVVAESKLDLSLAKFIAEEAKVKLLEDISYQDARTLLDKLSKYQNEGTPDKYKGFNSNWKSQLSEG